ncbi:hypothetical protein BJ742DRAFT_469812 [Cladochytrium replicatum]|nr:hypothetical protein BJ742DRAFT_469812 [Cladochytrium replicatum]
MVVCRFWLEGRCKFGNECRFEHSGGGGGGGGFASPDVGRGGGRGGHSRTNSSLAGGGRGGGGNIFTNLNNFDDGSSFNNNGFGRGGGSDRNSWGGDNRGSGGRGGGGRGVGGRGGGGRGGFSSADSFGNARFTIDMGHNEGGFGRGGGGGDVGGGRGGRGGAGGGRGRGYNDGGRHGGPQNNTQHSDREIESAMKTDLESTNGTGMWPLSSYGLYDHYILNGTDTSPEEMRLIFVAEQRKTGAVTNYLNLYGQLRTNVNQELATCYQNPRMALQRAREEWDRFRESRPPSQAFMAVYNAIEQFTAGGVPPPQNIPSANQFGMGGVGGGAFNSGSHGSGGFGQPGFPTGGGVAPTPTPFLLSQPQQHQQTAPQPAFSFLSSNQQQTNAFGVQPPTQLNPASSFSFFSSQQGAFTGGVPSAGFSGAGVGVGVGVAFDEDDPMEPQDEEQFRAAEFTVGKIPEMPPPAALRFI